MQLLNLLFLILLDLSQNLKVLILYESKLSQFFFLLLHFTLPILGQHFILLSHLLLLHILLLA